MGDMSRKEAITWLRIIKADMRLFPQISASKKIKALDFAINSLEIDEMYRLEYEKTLERKRNEQNISSKLGTD